MNMTVIRRVRPLGIIILEIIALGSSAWNGLRLSEAFFFWKTLTKFGASPQYIAISGGIWFISGITLATGIWLRKTWAWAGTIGCMAGYSVWYWLDRLFLQVPHSNWLFALTFTVLMLLISVFILFSPKTRSYFNLL